jgi:hypothetical protein
METKEDGYGDIIEKTLLNPYCACNKGELEVQLNQSLKAFENVLFNF